MITFFLKFKILPLFAFFLLASTGFAQNEGVKVFSKMKLEVGNYDHSLFEVMKNGILIMKDSGRKKINIPIEKDFDYIFTYEKKGYISKSIEFSTKNIPEKRWKIGFSPHNVTVVLEAQKDTNVPLFYKNPVGVIFYDKGINDFLERKDYSLTTFSKSFTSTTTFGTLSQKKNYNLLKKYFLKRREMRKLKETGKRMRNSNHKKKLYKIVRKKDPL